jgi:hypothetical protein
MGTPLVFPYSYTRQTCFFSTFQMKCPMSIRVRCKDGETLEITNIVHEHNHEVSKADFSHLFHQRRLDSGQKN